ncbi:MAG TPA: hypothetical protein P5171_02430 [Xanthomonadaceae bacterium]|nr:hypothetical protein [Xanthomonadaceae bacterium]HRX98959.1 hypothetical protein [Xanthomonadaceae bacterium]
MWRLRSSPVADEAIKVREKLRVVLAIVLAIAGAGLVIFSVQGMMRFGVYLSNQGSPDQLQGGFLPYVFILGLLMISWGLFDWMSRD